jgi:serine/threonine protein phosphatase PrpC
MILGCDGIWETMSDEEIIRFVKIRLDKSRQNKKSNSEQVMGNLVEILLDNLIAPDT